MLNELKKKNQNDINTYSNLKRSPLCVVNVCSCHWVCKNTRGELCY